jgi:DNA excision repair protein ERCC-4
MTSQNSLPAKLDPESITAIIDTREQQPLDVAPLRFVRGTLCAGDYALAACPDVCRIERKSLQDLVGCVGVERERFEREIDRLLAFQVRILLVESSWEAIESHEPINPQWRGKVTREAVLGSLMGWQAKGLSVHMAGNHERAGKHAARILFTVANRRYRELRSLVAGVRNASSVRDVEAETSEAKTNDETKRDFQ